MNNPLRNLFLLNEQRSRSNHQNPNKPNQNRLQTLDLLYSSNHYAGFEEGFFCRKAFLSSSYQEKSFQFMVCR